MKDGTQLIDGSFFFVLVAVLLVAFAGWRYFFAKRPRLSKNIWKEENKATHPSQYQNLHDRHAGVGPVKIKQAVTEKSIETSISKADRLSAKKSSPMKAAVMSALDNVSSGRHNPAIIILHVQTDAQSVFSGEDIMRAANDLGLIYSRMGVFHYYSMDDAEQPWFTIANMLEPGVFNLSAMDQFSTVGISLFMQTENTLASSITRFESMVVTANAIARKLNGKVMDASHHKLNEEHLMQIRNRIRAAFHSQDVFVTEPV